MKLRIEIETPRVGVLLINALQNALRRPETAELLGAYGPGDEFKIDNGAGTVIKFTVVEK